MYKEMLDTDGNAYSIGKNNKINVCWLNMRSYQWPILLKWIYFKSSMDK